MTHPLTTLLHHFSQLCGDHVNTLHGGVHELSYLVFDNILKGHVGCEETHPHSQLILDGYSNHLMQLFTICLKLHVEWQRTDLKVIHNQ